MARFYFRLMCFAGVLCLPLAPGALASDDAHGPEAGAAEVLPVGNFWNSLATLVTFGLVLFILGKFAWKPLLKALQARENFIRDSLRTAKKDREDAEATLAKYTGQMEKARSEATAIVEEGRRDAEVVRRQIHEQAKSEADAMIERARREIQIARDTAVKDLYTLSGDLATDLAARIIQKEIDASTHERLIQESIEKIAGNGSRN